MNTYVIDLREIGKTDIMDAGGKGANLGELSKIEGIRVPEGFCLNTEAYKCITDHHEALHILQHELKNLKPEQRKQISEISAKIRTIIEKAPIPEAIVAEIRSALRKFDVADAFAVRSSATAEDLPTASFAGQQDTYLNIFGEDSILEHIRKCWSSLFTERAIIYRIQNDFDHNKIHLSVIVQKMILPQVSGIMFTADPVSSNRKVVAIDAAFGLGEAIVSGLVNTDRYIVREGKIIDKKISAKLRAIYPLQNGGTKEQEIEVSQQHTQTLTQEQILELEQIGRKIEKHFGYPQDIEWCQADGIFYIVQSRPITTLYPIPEIQNSGHHVYISVGHQQMMTDPMKPLGLSLWQLTAFRPMFKAGGRLFVDIIDQLSSPVTQKVILQAMGQHDPLIKDAILNLIEQGDFIKPLSQITADQLAVRSSVGKSSAEILAPTKNEVFLASDLIRENFEALTDLKQNISTKSGTELFDFILEDIQQLRKQLSAPRSMHAIMASFDAFTWINENMMQWLGEKNTADLLAQSVPNNITSEMGLDLLQVADKIRPYPEVISYLQQVKEDIFLETLFKYDGGKEAHEAICSYLDKYGMRCAGEIDITRARWNEKPLTLLPLILNHIKNFESGVDILKFEHGQRKAFEKEQELLGRLKLLPDGEQKAKETKEMIDLLRKFTGYREYPKYWIINHLWICKQALMQEAERLVLAGVIREQEDVFLLTFEEFREMVGHQKIDYRIIDQRKAEYDFFKKLTPPRVITSDGEIVSGNYNTGHLPAGAFAGLAVSGGIVEGRARVILNMEDAILKEGDILVTRFTDPSWTPLFVSIKGVITEVGGLMTHGAVIAREYGLPAVVGVEHATQLIKDGQKIRINGTEGYVQIL